MKQFTLKCGCVKDRSIYSYVWVESPKTGAKRYCSVLLAAFSLIVPKPGEPEGISNNLQKLYDKIVQASDLGHVILDETELGIIADRWYHVEPKQVELPKSYDDMWELRTGTNIDVAKYKNDEYDKLKVILNKQSSKYEYEFKYNDELIKNSYIKR